jgi:aconitate hydratase
VSVTGNDTLKTRRSLTVDGKAYDYFSLDAAAKAAGLGDVSRLPFSLKVLLENLVRLENGRTVTVDDIKALGAWLENKTSEREIASRLSSISRRCARRWSISAVTRRRSTRCRRSIW